MCERERAIKSMMKAYFMTTTNKYVLHVLQTFAATIRAAEPWKTQASKKHWKYIQGKCWMLSKTSIRDWAFNFDRFACVIFTESFVEYISLCWQTNDRFTYASLAMTITKAKIFIDAFFRFGFTVADQRLQWHRERASACVHWFSM